MITLTLQNLLGDMFFPVLKYDGLEKWVWARIQL